MAEEHSRVQAKMGRPLKFTSAVEMERIIEAYFEEQDKKSRPYTITGLARCLGLTRKNLLEYQNREAFINVIAGAKTRIEERVEENLLTGKNQAGCQFWLKNQGWSDKQEIEVSDLASMPKEDLLDMLHGLLGTSRPDKEPAKPGRPKAKVVALNEK